LERGQLWYTLSNSGVSLLIGTSCVAQREELFYRLKQLLWVSDGTNCFLSQFHQKKPTGLAKKAAFNFQHFPFRQGLSLQGRGWT